MYLGRDPQHPQLSEQEHRGVYGNHRDKGHLTGLTIALAEIGGGHGRYLAVWPFWSSYRLSWSASSSLATTTVRWLWNSLIAM